MMNKNAKGTINVMAVFTLISAILSVLLMVTAFFGAVGGIFYLLFKMVSTMV